MTTAMQEDRQPDPRKAFDEAEILAMHGRVLEGWNRGSGEAFAAPFSEDADFVAFDGTVFRGRRKIAEAHQELFDRWLKGSRLIGERTEVRFLGPDIAIVLAVGGTVMRGKSKPAPERDSIQTLVAVREGGAWSFASFQNTRIRPIGDSAMSAFLWLVADKLWRLVFRLSKTVPRKTTGLSGT